MYSALNDLQEAVDKSVYLLLVKRDLIIAFQKQS